jgi:gliding motility-associated-like protein
MKRFFFFINSLLFLFHLSNLANAQSNQTVVNGNPTTAVNFPGTGCTFNWINDQSGIGLPASGMGDIPSFTAINTGLIPVVATITVTPTVSQFAYLANGGSNTVSVVDINANTLVATIPVGKDPCDIAVSPDGTRIYVANNQSNSISVINTVTKNVITEIPVGITPFGTTISPDGKWVYVAIEGSGSVSVINTATNTITATIPVGDIPQGIITSPDGSRVYVSNLVGNTISVINTATNTVINTISAITSPTGVAVSPDGSHLYVAGNNGYISVINTANSQLITAITVGSLPGSISLSVDGSRLYVANAGSNNVSIINTATNSVLSTIPVATFPDGVSVNATGDILYVTSSAQNSLSAFNLATQSLIATIPVGKDPVSFGNFIKIGTCNSAPVTFTITVNPSPYITVGAVTGSINACLGNASVSPNIQQFSVSGSYLAGDIIVNAPAGFEVSLAAASGYSNGLVLGQSFGTVSNTIVYVRSSASSLLGNLSGNVILTSQGAVTQNMAVTATVNASPVVDFILPDVCLADAYAQFNDKSTIADNTQAAFTYLWDFGDTYSTAADNTSTLQNPRHKYSHEANYIITLTVASPSGCTVTKSKNFTVNGAVPLAGFTVENKSNLCSADDVVFDDNSSVDFGNITRIVWFFDYNNHPTDSVVYTTATMRADKKYTHNYGLFNNPQQQNYSVMMIAYSGQICKNVVQQTITINANPLITLSPAGPLTLCRDDVPIQIIENKNGFAGTGVFSGTGVSPTGLFDPKISGPGTFTINYLFTATTGCTYAANMQVTVNPSPVVSIDVPEITLVEGSLTTLPAKAAIASGNITYKWSPSLGLSRDDILNPIASPADKTTYILTVTSDKFCSASAQILINVLKKPVAPNTFTPNGDGINDAWNIKYIDNYPNCTVEVFNRYGEKLFFSRGYPVAWDGKYSGTDVPAGVYYYVINLGSDNPSVSGSVTIIR